jgi:hypothetical protein
MGDCRSHHDAAPRQTDDNIHLHAFMKQEASELLSGILA